MPEDRAISPATNVRNPMEPRKAESGGGGMVGTIGDYARFAQMLLNGGTFEGRRYLKPETIALMASDHIGPETGIARDSFTIRARPAASASVSRCVPPPAEYVVAAGGISLGRRCRHLLLHRPGGRYVRVFMVQTPSQRGRIQLQLKTLIYEALGRG